MQWIRNCLIIHRSNFSADKSHAQKSVIIYQACQTSKIPQIACSLRRVEVKSPLDFRDTTWRAKFFLVGWLVECLVGFFVVCVWFLCFSCALLVHLISVSGKIMVSIFPSFHFILLAMKTMKNPVDQVMLKTPQSMFCIRRQNSEFKRCHCPLSILWIECSCVAEMWSEMLERAFFRQKA